MLEHCEHGSLKTFLGPKTAYDEESRAFIEVDEAEVGTWAGLRHGLAIGVAKGLEYLHHGLNEILLHRDIKPDNILVTEELKAKVADFGESTRFDEEAAAKSDDV